MLVQSIGAARTTGFFLCRFQGFKVGIPHLKVAADKGKAGLSRAINVRVGVLSRP